jgi:hypothetical protein
MLVDQRQTIVHQWRRCALALGWKPGILRQLSGLVGCTNPFRLDGYRTEYDVDTTTGEIGKVLHRLDLALPALLLGEEGT